MTYTEQMKKTYATNIALVRVWRMWYQAFRKTGWEPKAARELATISVKGH